jgi:hypothetical protein
MVNSTPITLSSSISARSCSDLSRALGKQRNQGQSFGSTIGLGMIPTTSAVSAYSSRARCLTSSSFSQCGMRDPKIVILPT